MIWLVGKNINLIPLPLHYLGLILILFGCLEVVEASLVARSRPPLRVHTIEDDRYPDPVKSRKARSYHTEDEGSEMLKSISNITASPSHLNSKERCTRNSLNMGNIINSLLTDYDIHLLPESEGVNVTIELHVQGISGISEITADFELDIMYRDEVKLMWHNNAVTMMEKIELPDFELVSWSIDKKQMDYPNGVWDRASVHFVFARRYGFYLFQGYFPSSLTTISSWVGFFFDVRSVSARITLGVSSLLALTFSLSSLTTLPKTSMIKMNDVWMIFNVIFIFSTLVELAIVCQLNRWEREKQIGNKVLGHWLNQIKKNVNKSDAGNNNNTSQLLVSATPRNRWAAVNDTVKKTTLNGSLPVENQIRITEINHPNGASSVIANNDPTAIQSNKNADCPFLQRTGSEIFQKEDKSKKRKWFNSLKNWLRLKMEMLCERDYTITSVQVDRVSMLLFPLSFLTFNIIYWSVYISKMDRPL